MSRSEIFDSFVKIAQEKGMISNDSDSAKKKLEKSHRADSLSITDIEALYGVKPDAPKNMEYEHNIMENAHPNSIVISPSYDKLNGLVENNNERQNIILHILDKTPNGNATNHKYAEKEFLSTLVSLANDLDNHNKDELRVLADACLMQMSAKKKAFKKEALGPLAIAGLVALPIGALWIQQQMHFINEGYEKNHEKLVAELDDMLNSSASWGVGVDYKKPLLDMVSGFKDRLMSMYNLFKQIEPLVNELEKPKDATELIEISKKPETGVVIKALQSFHAAAYKMLSYVKTLQNDFKSESFKARQVQDKGWMQGLVDKMQIFHGGKGLVADDFDDVNRAIPPYLDSINEILNIFKNAKSVVEDAKQKLSQLKAEDTQFFGVTPDAAAPETTPAASPAETKPNPRSGLHADLSSLTQMLGGK